MSLVQWKTSLQTVHETSSSLFCIGRISSIQIKREAVRLELTKVCHVRVWKAQAFSNTVIFGLWWNVHADDQMHFWFAHLGLLCARLFSLFLWFFFLASCILTFCFSLCSDSTCVLACALHVFLSCFSCSLSPCLFNSLVPLGVSSSPSQELFVSSCLSPSHWARHVLRPAGGSAARYPAADERRPRLNVADSPDRENTTTP